MLQRRSYRESIFTDIQDGSYEDDPELDKPVNTGDPNFDWSRFGVECLAGINMPDNAATWIQDTSEAALEHFFQQNDQVTLTESNLLLANELQRIAISMVAKHHFHIANHEEDCNSCEPHISMLLGGTLQQERVKHCFESSQQNFSAVIQEEWCSSQSGSNWCCISSYTKWEDNSQRDTNAKEEEEKRSAYHPVV